MKQHKWHKEIKAWADGAEIEGRSLGKGLHTSWISIIHPEWVDDNSIEYRIKPQPKISYKETIIERLRTDDEFWNEVFSAYDKKCDNEKSQSKANCCKHGIKKGKCTLGESDCKEPQYYYVWINHKGEVKFNEPNKLCETSQEYKYIGKIKLEDTE